MSLIVRPLNVNDVGKIIDLEMKYLGETLGSDMLISESTNPNIKFMVLEKNHVLIGYIGFYIFEEYCELLNFVIDECFQRQGYGTYLFNEVIKQTKAKNITLEVKENNLKAINFYVKHGFKQISKRLKYYSDGHDAIVMEKVIE